MNFIRYCLDHPVTVSVGVILVVMFGLLSLLAIPVQLTPNVDTPIITVSTRWAGANPQEIEREIVDRQEEFLRSVKSLQKMTSESRDNAAKVVLEFSPGMDKNEALRDVSDKLRQVTGYPIEVDEPTVAAADASVDNPMAWLILFSDTKDPNDQEIRKLRDFVEDFVQPYLDRVDGVASTDIYGGLEREMQVRVDAGKLASRGLTLSQVRDALRRQNENISAGTRWQGKRDYAIRTVGQYENEQDILSTVVAYTSGGPVYVRDVAEVELSFKDPEGFVRSKGQYVLAFPVRREVGANVVTVMDNLKVAIARVNEDVLKARGMHVELVQVYDETVYIRQAIEMVRSNITFGSALVLGLLLVFLRSWRATAVLALSIPVSVIGTFLIIVALGRTLNVISLAGIAFAVGDVVDSAYVVLENIFRHRQMGKDARTSVLDGTREVWGAVLASTLTTMAVFLPVIFIQEEAGQLFRDISIAEVAAVGLSMIVAVTVVPPLAVRLLGRDKAKFKFPTEDQPLTKKNATTQGERKDIVMWFAGLIASLVDRINGTRMGRALVILGMTFGSLAMARLLVPDATYLPAGNRNLVFGFLITPPGYSLDEFGRMGNIIEKVVAPYWEAEPGSPEHKQLDRKWIEQVEAKLAANAIQELNNKKLSSLERSRAKREWLTPPPLIDNFFFVSFDGGCFMGCSSRDPASVEPLVRLLETAGQLIPGTFSFFQQTQLFSFGGGNTAEIQIRGDDLEKVTAAALAMQGECMKRFSGYPRAIPGNFALGRPETRILIDRERAADLGLDVTDVGLIVEACVDGAFVGDFRQKGGDTIDISLFMKDQKDRPTQEIAQLPIYSPAGRVVPLSAAVSLVGTTSLEQINHIERQRAVTLEIKPPESMALEAVIRQIKDEIEPQLRANGAIDASVLVSLTGNADKLVAARNSLVGAWKGWTTESLTNIISGRFFLSVIIVYLLMCALYESWVYPFVIMFSVPLAIFGGFFGLSLAHWGTMMSTHQPVQQLDVLTFLGFIMLVGLVVKNAILLVEQSLVYLREHNMPIRDSIREAVRVRVRPVCMTSLTSVFGLLPLALMPGSGSELYRGLAAVILGGMIVSTLGTFVLVPCVMCSVLEIRDYFKPERVSMVGEMEERSSERKPGPSTERVMETITG